MHELILLSLPIPLTQFASLAVEDSAAQAVSSLTSVELACSCACSRRRSCSVCAVFYRPDRIQR
jgi:hypothetical protein